MENKSAAATNEKVSNYIPDDLAFSILSKLPLKSLRRFGCIRKSWSLFFENPHFMNMYRNNFIGNTSLLLKQAVEDHAVLYLLSGERFESRVKLDWPPPFQDDDRYINILGSSVNGVLCLLRFTRNGSIEILWNPTTGEFNVIPHNPVEPGPHGGYIWDFIGFGYDHVRNDYKVIRCVNFFSPFAHEVDHYDNPDNELGDLEDISLDPLWEIYSLRSNSWGKLNMQTPFTFFGPDIGARLYTDGICHWWGEKETCIESCLISFDLSNEVFFTTPMPLNMGDARFNLGSFDLVVLNGSIAFVYNYTETATFQISILGELGVMESWTKLFIVGPLPCVQRPIGVGKKGDIFLIKKDGELAWFDLSAQMIVGLGIRGRELYCCQILTYNESFRSLL